MRKNLEYYTRYQVFLNYPFDIDFSRMEDALQFPIVAANLLPLCAKDLSTPDRPRLDMLVAAISNCHYSLHELSRSKGEGAENFARMNMPIETGMAMFHALHTQRRDHRCAFFVAKPHDYQRFASDLARLDPMCHNIEEDVLVGLVYEWLRGVVPSTIFNLQPTKSVVGRYHIYRDRLTNVNGSGGNDTPSHDEKRELMYQVCQEVKWWDWRNATFGREEFPVVPLLWKTQPNSTTAT
jgi:hypothetical protein